VTTPDGRVVIVETDDRDTAFGLLTSQPADCRGLNAFSEVFRLPMTRARRGHLLLSANIATSAAFVNQYIYIETMIVAYLASAPIIMLRTALDSNINLLEWRWDVPESYGALGIQAQAVIDGQPSSVTTGVLALQLSAAGFYWR